MSVLTGIYRHTTSSKYTNQLLVAVFLTQWSWKIKWSLEVYRQLVVSILFTLCIFTFVGEVFTFPPWSRSWSWPWKVKQYMWWLTMVLLIAMFKLRKEYLLNPVKDRYRLGTYSIWLIDPSSGLWATKWVYEIAFTSVCLSIRGH